MSRNFLRIPIETAMAAPSEIFFGDRARADYGDVDQLGESFDLAGIINPLAVFRIESPTHKYQLLAGGRRFFAAVQKGVELLPVRIYPSDLTIDEIKTIEKIENKFRKDLTWEEEVKLDADIHEFQVSKHGPKFSTKPDAEGWSQRDTAALLDKSPGEVSLNLRLAKVLKEGTVPQLAQAKSMSDARKVLKRLDKNEATAKTVAEITETRATVSSKDLKQMLLDSFVVGDFFVESEKLELGTFDFAEIDPPYGIDFDTFLADDTRNSRTHLSMDYTEIEAKKYKEFLDKTFAQTFKLLKDDAWVICWHAADPWHDVVLTSMREAGFKVRGIPLLWVKKDPNAITMNPGVYLGRSYETAFYGYKGQPKLFQQGRPDAFYHKCVPPQRKVHPTERPIEMIFDVLTTFVGPGSNILVPYAGSGATILAAANAMMTSKGFDLSENYKNSFSLRVLQGEFGMYKQ